MHTIIMIMYDWKHERFQLEKKVNKWKMEQENEDQENEHEMK